MLAYKRLATVFAAVACLGLATPALEARSAKGDRLYAQGREAEQARDYDKALDLYEQAVSTSSTDVAYLMAFRRVRFQAGQAHADKGQKLREEGKFEEALAEYQRAGAIDPSSPVAAQEIRRTLDMIATRDRQRKAGVPDQPVLAPGVGARRAIDERLAAVMSVPELKPIAALPQNLRINNQPARVMFETVCKLAGINVIFDQDFVSNTTPRSLELNSATLDEALGYISMMTRAFWKPISSNAIFVTQDTQQKRNDYEEQVAKIIYINNAGSKEDLNEITTGIRAMIPTVRMQPLVSQNAVLIRGTADQVSLVEMMVRNLDRPKAEVVVDVIVMEVNRSKSRDLALTPTSGSSSGISVVGGLTSTSSSSEDGTTTTSAGSVLLSRLGKLSSNDFSITLPGASLEALMSDSNTRILQAPQVRAIDNMKASLKIGDRQPYSTGGIQSLTTGTTASSLYNSFQYLDVGVNVDITPKIHGTEEVSLHIELDISSIKERIEIAGIAQPVVGQRKIVHDIRLREGEVNLLGGLVQEQETKAVGGVPGLSSIPVIRRLFTSESTTRTQSELLIALVPRIVRTPDLDDLSYKGIASGSMNTIRLNYASQPSPQAEPAAAKPDVTATKPEAIPAASPVPVSPAVTPSSVPLVPGLPPIGMPPAPAAAKPAAAPRVRLTPDKVEAPMGGTFTLNVQVENVNDLAAAPLRLKFDPNVLQLQDVSRGSFLAADGRDVIFTRNIRNEAGESSVELRRMPGNTGMSGSGSLATLTFQVIGKGVTTITAPQLSFQDSRAAEILSASPQVTVTIK